MTNTNKLGLWTVLSCSSAEFDGPTTTAEYLLRWDYTEPSNPKGALAFIGSQAYTSYLFNDPLDQGIYLAWTDSGATMPGQALLAGKLYAWATATGLTSGERNSGMNEYTLLGDPSVQMFTDVPTVPTVTLVPNQVPVGTTTNVTVTVSAPSGSVPYALVCLRKSGDLYVWGYTNRLGQLVLAVSPTTAGDIDVTMTAYNVRTYLGTFPATAVSQPASPANVAATSSAMAGITLTWSPVTQDVLGNPITIHHYDVYRHTVAHFTIDGLTPIAAPTGTTYTDPGAAGDPSVNRFYRIVAVSLSQGSSAPSSAVGEFDYQLQQ